MNIQVCCNIFKDIIDNLMDRETNPKIVFYLQPFITMIDYLVKNRIQSSVVSRYLDLPFENQLLINRTLKGDSVFTNNPELILLVKDYKGSKEVTLSNITRVSEIKANFDNLFKSQMNLEEKLEVEDLGSKEDYSSKVARVSAINADFNNLYNSRMDSGEKLEIEDLGSNEDYSSEVARVPAIKANFDNLFKSQTNSFENIRIESEVSEELILNEPPRVSEIKASFDNLFKSPKNSFGNNHVESEVTEGNLLVHPNFKGRESNFKSIENEPSTIEIENNKNMLLSNSSLEFKRMSDRSLNRCFSPPVEPLKKHSRLSTETYRGSQFKRASGSSNFHQSSNVNENIRLFVKLVNLYYSDNAENTLEVRNNIFEEVEKLSRSPNLMSISTMLRGDFLSKLKCLQSDSEFKSMDTTLARILNKLSCHSTARTSRDNSTESLVNKYSLSRRSMIDAYVENQSRCKTEKSVRESKLHSNDFSFDKPRINPKSSFVERINTEILDSKFEVPCSNETDARMPNIKNELLESIKRSNFENKIKKLHEKEVKAIKVNPLKTDLRLQSPLLDRSPSNLANSPKAQPIRISKNSNNQKPTKIPSFPKIVKLSINKTDNKENISSPVLNIVKSKMSPSSGNNNQSDNTTKLREEIVKPIKKISIFKNSSVNRISNRIRNLEIENEKSFDKNVYSFSSLQDKFVKTESEYSNNQALDSQFMSFVDSKNSKNKIIYISEPLNKSIQKLGDKYPQSSISNKDYSISEKMTQANKQIQKVKSTFENKIQKMDMTKNLNEYLLPSANSAVHFSSLQLSSSLLKNNSNGNFLKRKILLEDSCTTDLFVNPKSIIDSELLQESVSDKNKNTQNSKNNIFVQNGSNISINHLSNYLAPSFNSFKKTVNQQKGSSREFTFLGSSDLKLNDSKQLLYNNRNLSYGNLFRVN